MGAQFALNALGFLFNVLVIRRLGDTNYGQYTVVLAWAGLFSFIGDMGITQFLTREIARDKQQLQRLLWDVGVLRFLLAIVAAIVTVGGAVANGYDSRTVLAIGLYTVSYFMQAVLAPLAGVIAGHERLDIVSVYQVIGQIIFMAFGALFLFAGLDFVWLVIASLINLPILIVLCVWTIRRNQFIPPKFKINTDLWWNLLRAGLPFAFIQLALTAAFQLDSLILKSYYPSEDVGWYGAAYSLTRAFLVLTSAFSSSLVVTLAREHAQNPDTVRPWYYRSVKFMLFLGLPLAVGGTLLADKIINLAYGSTYAPSAVAFAILIWDTPLLMYTALCGNMTTSIQKEKYAMRIYICEAVLNVVTNLILIPRFGVIAASFTTCGTELTGVLLFYIFFRREFGAGLGLRHAARLGLAAVLMGVVVFFLHDFNLLISVGVGGMVYLVLVWGLKALTPEERDLVIGIGRRVARPVLRRLGRA